MNSEIEAIGIQNESLASLIKSNFHNDVIREALKEQFSNTKTKITDDAVELISELMKTLVIEASVRAAKQATIQDQKSVTLESVESILAQIMLDFP